jgi:hypothetical protein
MKKISFLKVTLLAFFFTSVTSCDEDKFLEEVPLDFYSPENSYQTLNNFEAGLTDLYARVREIHYSGDRTEAFTHFLATDIAEHARGDANRFGDYNVWMNPTNNLVRYHWNEWYKVIGNANTIIGRAESSAMTADQEKRVVAEAKFFRALAYRYLVYLYGGVPLILEEVSTPKTDFLRATKEEVLNQMVADFKEASDNLSSIDQAVDGRISNLVAAHYLAETHVALKNYDQAIATANLVIDNPNTALMTSRFGSRATVTPGDVFWDLFQRGNQNRRSGNKEALFVVQMELDIPGGFLESSGDGNHKLERWAGPVAWLTFQDPDRREGMIRLPQSNYNAGGRGVSFMKNTDYWLNELWQSDFNNDIRNASHNIVRDVFYNNPASRWNDSSAVKYPSPTRINQAWRWYPYPTKITTPGDHPDLLFIDKSALTLQSTAGTTYTDQYLLRLAETYLLRAEAYLLKGDLGNAARDVNVVRQRVNAKPVIAGNVTLDYILDERARELVYEEQRRITLSRTGKLVERVRKYNKLNADEIQDFHALFPIPFAEIEANNMGNLQQNPGY